MLPNHFIARFFANLTLWKHSGNALLLNSRQPNWPHSLKNMSPSQGRYYLYFHSVKNPEHGGDLLECFATVNVH